jgi:hypothetical protein
MKEEPVIRRGLLNTDTNRRINLPMGCLWWTFRESAALYHPASNQHAAEIGWMRAGRFSDWKLSAPEDYREWAEDTNESKAQTQPARLRPLENPN